MTTAGGPSDQYIQISDFTPGILSSRSGGIGPTPNRPNQEDQTSYARIEGTWGCYGHPLGGLHPLPRITDRYKIPVSTGSLWADSSDPYLSPRTDPGAHYNDGNDPTEVAFEYEPWEYITATHLMSPIEGSFYNSASDMQVAVPEVPNNRSPDPNLSPTRAIQEPNPDILSFSTQRSALKARITTGVLAGINEYRTYIRWRQLRFVPPSLELANLSANNPVARSIPLYWIVSQKQDTYYGYSNRKFTISGVVDMYATPTWPNLFAAAFTTMTSGTYWDSTDAVRYGETITLGGIAFAMPGRIPGYSGIVWQTTSGSFNNGPVGNVPTSHHSGISVVLWPSFTYNFPNSTMMNEDRAFIVPGLGAGNGVPGSPLGYTGYIMLVHQSRLLVCSYIGMDSASREPGANSYFGPLRRLRTTDAWFYSPVNHLTGIVESAHSDRRFWPVSPPTRFGAATTGFGAAASMNASELFLIRDTGGGAIVRGDLETPQVTDYPGVPSTNGAANIPTITHLGMVYGTRDGVYAWAGADQVQKLSNQLEGWFWKPEDGSTISNAPGLSHGKFAFAPPFIYAPNNWVCDTRTGGWFRLSDPDELVYKDFNASITGKVYATPGRFNKTNPVVADRFDPSVGAHKWRWASQTLPVSSGKIVKFSEAIIVAAGKGRITLTLTGMDGGTQTVAFDINTTEPTELSARLNVETHDAYISLAATGDETVPLPPAPDGPDAGNIVQASYQTSAPTLYRISFGVSQRRSVQQVN